MADLIWMWIEHCAQLSWRVLKFIKDFLNTVCCSEMWTCSFTKTQTTDCHSIWWGHMRSLKVAVNSINCSLEMSLKMNQKWRMKKTLGLRLLTFQSHKRGWNYLHTSVETVIVLSCFFHTSRKGREAHMLSHLRRLMSFLSWHTIPFFLSHTWPSAQVIYEKYINKSVEH